MSVATAVSRETISSATGPIDWDLGLIRKSVRFALTLVGHALVYCGTWVQRFLNARLERDTYALRGIRTAVKELDPRLVLDGTNEVKQLLQMLEHKVLELHGIATKAKEDRHLLRLRSEFARTVELCAAMQEAIVALEDAIIEHDLNAATFGQDTNDDLKRLSADLRRKDDVPAGHYAELASVLRDVPESRNERGGGRIPR